MSRQDLPPVFPADVELRGFVDALAPLRRQQEWRMEKCQIQLGIAQTALSEALQQLEFARQEQDRQVEAMSGAMHRGFGAVNYRHGLAFLVLLRQEVENLTRVVVACRDERDRCRADIVVLQRHLDGLSRHREAALASYCTEWRRRMSQEQDRAWLASWAVGGQTGGVRI